MTESENRNVLRREKHYGCDDVYFVVRGECNDATESNDVEIPIPPDHVEIITQAGWTGESRQPINAGDPEYPRCPDCGGEIMWAENGHVPGTRKCMECESFFADMRFHAQS